MLPLLEIVLLSVVVLIPTAVLLFHWSHRHIYKHTKNIPPVQPKQPLLRNALSFKGTSEERINLVLDMFNHVSEIATWWFGPKLYIFVQKPEYLKILLNHPAAIDKDPLTYQTLKMGIGNGLITENEDTWKGHRRIMAPAFNDLNVNRFCKVLSKHAKVLNDKLQTVEHQEFDFENLFVNSSIDSFYENFLNLKSNAVVENGTLPHVLANVTDLLFKKLTTFYTNIDFIYKFTKLKRELESNIKIVKEIVNDAIDRKLKEYKDSKELKQNSVLDLLIYNYLNDKLTKEEVFDQVQTLMFAGTDTTGLAMCLSLTLLSMNPEVQEKLYQEISEVLEPDEEELDLNKINQLTYLDCVIKESLRLIPVVPFNARYTKEDIKLSDTITIPKGVATLTSIFFLHRSERYWPNALKFDPDRFLPDNVSQRHPYCFIPFAAGPRKCLGKKYSMLSLKIKMALVLREFRFYSDYKSVFDIPLKIDVITHVPTNLKVKCERRSK